MRQAVAQFHNIVKGNRTDNAHVVVCVFAPPVQQAGTVEQAHKLAKAKTCVAFVSVADFALAFQQGCPVVDRQLAERLFVDLFQDLFQDRAGFLHHGIIIPH